ncbi:MAG: ATP-binding protein [Gemmatimonadaceae bacterium]
MAGPRGAEPGTARLTGPLSAAPGIPEAGLTPQESEVLRAAELRARARAERLGQLAMALSEASTLDDVLSVAVRAVTAAFAGSGTVVTRLVADGSELEILRAHALPDSLAATWQRFPLAAPVPLAVVARTGESIFLESRADWYAHFPSLADALEATGHHANAVLPLVAQGRVTGAMGIAFDRSCSFDEDERALAVAIARQCAVAIERAYLFDDARRARMEAERSNKAKSEFLAVMSHELRTPLNAIGGYAQLLELEIHGPMTGAQLEAIRRIQKSQMHLLGLINEVLNYARVETGNVAYEITAVPVDQMVVTSELLLAPQVRAKGQSLSFASCDRTLAVRADREKLQQIILNLLSNAVKFTDRGGAISLSCSAEREMVAIRVADTGCGIAPDHLERVFEPFVQVDARRTRRQEGTGLGLAISRDLARGMGGDLTIESAVGRGSTFMLTLPAA